LPPPPPQPSLPRSALRRRRTGLRRRELGGVELRMFSATKFQPIFNGAVIFEFCAKIYNFPRNQKKLRYILLSRQYSLFPTKSWRQFEFPAKPVMSFSAKPPDSNFAIRQLTRAPHKKTRQFIIFPTVAFLHYANLDKLSYFNLSSPEFFQKIFDRQRKRDKTFYSRATGENGSKINSISNLLLQVSGNIRPSISYLFQVSPAAASTSSLSSSLSSSSAIFLIALVLFFPLAKVNLEPVLLCRVLQHDSTNIYFKTL
jgi:hypothetical protein